MESIDEGVRIKKGLYVLGVIRVKRCVQVRTDRSRGMLLCIAGQNLTLWRYVLHCIGID